MKKKSTIQDGAYSPTFSSNSSVVEMGKRLNREIIKIMLGIVIV